MTKTSDITLEARARHMYTPIHNFLTDWLIDLWSTNNRETRLVRKVPRGLSQWLTDICETGTIDELKAAVIEEVRRMVELRGRP